MKNIPFIFSTEWKFILARHIAFWVVALFGQGLLQLGVRPLFNVSISHNMLMEFMLLPVLYLPGQLLLVYSILYFVIPRYVLHGQYRMALIWLCSLTILSAFIAELSYSIFNSPFRAAFMEPVLKIGTADSQVKITSGSEGIDWASFPFQFVFGLRAVINVGGFAAAIKLMKHWYEKEYRNTILQKEKLDVELKSLKAQIHPHFLFNTLNNIFSITEKTSPQASDVVMRLSNLLRYILYDCNQSTVELSKEWKMLEDYVALEKIRYRNLDVKLNLPKHIDSKMIAPLLLLPLIENCFKHGTSQMLDAPWINVTADLKDDILSVKLINGKSEEYSGKEKLQNGIGLENLRKRLGLLYPNQHEFSATSEEGVFVANLKVKLTTAS